MTVARSVAQVIAGEAVSGTREQRWNDMLNIASVIQNRAAMLGISPEAVVSAQNQFSAYGTRLPPGVGQSIVDMAQAAMDQVQTQGPVNSATYYATPAAVDNLPNNLSFETETTGHRYFSDPLNRGIIADTQGNALTSNLANMPLQASQDPLQAALTRPYSANGLTNAGTSLLASSASPQAVTSVSTPKVAADPAFGANGLLTGDPQTFAGLLGPATTGWSEMAAANPVRAVTPNNFAEMANAGPMGVNFASPVDQAMQSPYSANGLTNTISSASSLPSNTARSISLPGSPPDAAFGSNGLMTGDFPGENSLPALGDPSRMMAQPALVSGLLNTPQAIFDAPAPVTDSFSQVAAANPITASSLSTPQALATQAQAEQNLADMQAQRLAQANSSVLSQSPVSKYSEGMGLLSVPGTVQSVRNAMLSDQQQAMATPAFNQALSNNIPSLSQPTPPSITRLDGTIDQAQVTNIANSLPPSYTPTNTVMSYQEQPALTPAEQAINTNFGPALLSGQPIANTPSTLTAPTNTGLLSTPALPSSFEASNIAPDTHLAIGDIPGMDVPSVTTQPTTSGVNIAEDPAVSMPALTTKTYPDQPTIAGPATTDATTQQTQAQTQSQHNPNASFPAAPQKQGILGQMGINKSMLAGGLLGGAFGGPFGALAGGLLGNVVNSQGGLSHMFGNTSLGSSPFSSINNIGSGLSNVASVYGGAPAGTQATTNNGGSVTSYGDGRVAYTNRYGVTTVSGPNGYNAADWSGLFGGDQSGVNGGVDTSGFSPGLF